MCLVEDIPFLMRTIYRLHGVIQFSCNTPPKSFLAFFYRLYCLPVVLVYGYCCYSWLGFYINIADTSPAKVDLIISGIGIASSIVSLISFVVRSNKLKILLLELNAIKTKSPEAQKRGTNWMRIGILSTVIIHFVFILVFPAFSDSCVYYFMPTAIGLSNHLFLDEILHSIRWEFTSINKELERYCIENVALDYQEMCRIDEFTLRHCDLVSVTIDINKLFDIVTISSMIAWLVYAIDFFYYLINSLLVENTRITVLAFGISDALLMLLWFSMMVRMYSRTQNEVTKMLMLFVLLLIFFCRQTEERSSYTMRGINIAKNRTHRRK